MPAMPMTTRAYKVHTLREIHHEICRLAVTGMKPSVIASELGVGKAVVEYTLQSPLGRYKVTELRTQRDKEASSIAERITAVAGRAMDYLEKVVDGEEAAHVGLRVKVAGDFLDRAGHAKVSRNMNLNINTGLDEKELSALHEHAIRVGIDNGTIVPLERSEDD